MPFTIEIRAILIFVFSWITPDLMGEIGSRGQTKALEVLEKSSAYYQSLVNFKAIYDCTITIQDPGLQEPLVHASKMVLTVSGEQYRLALDGQETITDGQTVWVHDQSMKEVTIRNYNFKEFSFNFASLYKLCQKQYKSVYVKQHVINLKKNQIRDVIQLTASQEDEDFETITLEVDRATGQVCDFEMEQNEEVSYTYKIKSFKKNIALPDDYFTFDLTKHDLQEIIDLREDEAGRDNEHLKLSDLDPLKTDEL